MCLLNPTTTYEHNKSTEHLKKLKFGVMYFN